MSSSLAKRFPKLPSSQVYSPLLESRTNRLKVPRKQATNELNLNKVSNVNCTILQTPLRSCLLTSKVLPKSYLIRCTLVGPDHNRILTPTELLHSKFEMKASGKGFHVLCRKEAFDMLVTKGSYKRISPNVSLNSNITNQIQSQLARRISQEFYFLSERSKSERPRDASGTKKQSLIQEIKEEDWMNILNNNVGKVGEKSGLDRLEREGLKLELVISLAPPSPLPPASSSPSSTSSSPTISTPLCQFITSSTLDTSTNVSIAPKSKIPFYTLYPFLSSAILPPHFTPLRNNSSISTITPSSTSTLSTSATETIPVPLVDEIKRTLDSSISMFNRRIGIHLKPISNEIEGATVVKVEKERIKLELKPLEELGNYYAIYTRIPKSIDSNEMNSNSDKLINVDDLLISLWRCTLWTGEGWI